MESQWKNTLFHFFFPSVSLSKIFCLYLLPLLSFKKYGFFLDVKKYFTLHCMRHVGDVLTVAACCFGGV